MNGFKFLKETMNLAGISRGVEGGGGGVKSKYLEGEGFFDNKVQQSDWLIFITDPLGYLGHVLIIMFVTFSSLAEDGFK